MPLLPKITMISEYPLGSRFYYYYSIIMCYYQIVLNASFPPWAGTKAGYKGTHIMVGTSRGTTISLALIRDGGLPSLALVGAGGLGLRGPNNFYYGQYLERHCHQSQGWPASLLLELEGWAWGDQRTWLVLARGGLRFRMHTRMLWLVLLLWSNSINYTWPFLPMAKPKASSGVATGPGPGASELAWSREEVSSFLCSSVLGGSLFDTRPSLSSRAVTFIPKMPWGTEKQLENHSDGSVSDGFALRGHRRPHEGRS